MVSLVRSLRPHLLYVNRSSADGFCRSRSSFPLVGDEVALFRVLQIRKAVLR